jgi:hypothetical protein
MKINKILISCLCILFTIFNLYGQHCKGKSQRGIDIYYQDLTYVHSITSIPYRDFLKPYNLNKLRQVVHIENSDTVREIRNLIDHVKNRCVPQNDFDSYIDTYIAIVDHERQDTISLSRFPAFYMMYNDKVIQPDSAFSSFIYHKIDERDSEFIRSSFPDNEYKEQTKGIFD